MRSYIIGTILILCLLFCACARETPAPKPNFAGRLLFLSGDQTNGTDLFELTAGPNSTYNLSLITKGVFEAAQTYDQTALLLATKDGILLRDLRTGQDKSVVKGETYCLKWAPDGKHFSYKQRSEAGSKLYASDLDGKTNLVWADTSKNETVDRSCAHWVAEDKLIFDRMGPSQKQGPDVKPNSTTLATLNGTVRLMDADKKWSVEGLCKSGTAFLRSLEGEILIAKNLESPKTANPTSGPCSGCRFVGFAAQSCVPFFIEENSRDSSEIFYLNPTNWQRQKAAHIGQPFSPAARMLIGSSARLMIVGDAPASLLLVDTESGEVVPFFPKAGAPGASDPKLVNPVPVAWIEK